MRKKIFNPGRLVVPKRNSQSRAIENIRRKLIVVFLVLSFIFFFATFTVSVVKSSGCVKDEENINTGVVVIE